MTSDLRETALRLLTFREHSCKELKWKLSLKGFANTLIDQVLDELSQEGLLSDERFAESYIALRAQKGFGPLHIADQLRKRGIHESLIDAQLDSDHPDWQELAYKVQQKRYRNLPREPREYTRQVRFLKARGFTEIQIHRALGGNKQEL